jgi:hypothetical protein
MSNLQIKHVDEETHELIRRRARDAGVTLGEYILELIRKDLRRPTRSDWLDRVVSRPAFGTTHDDTIASIDADRSERDR